MSAVLENLKRDVRMRDETDKILSPMWIIVLVVPLIFYLSMILATFLGIQALVVVAAIFALPSLIFLILAVILLYMLIKRRNRHFYRQQLLLDDVVSAIRRMTSEKDIESKDKLSAFERNLRQTRMEETEKSAALWAILTVVPIVGLIVELYVLYFLTKDFYKHERREDSALEDLKELLAKCNLTFDMPRRSDVAEPIPERSFILYLVLSIITLGIFSVYWLYCLIEDPNSHFKYHVAVEEKLVDTFSSAISK